MCPWLQYTVHPSMHAYTVLSMPLIWTVSLDICPENRVNSVIPPSLKSYECQKCNNIYVPWLRNLCIFWSLRGIKQELELI